MGTPNHVESVPNSHQSLLTRISNYFMGIKILPNKTARIPMKATSDSQMKINHQFHQEIPSIKTDGHLVYYLYITIQNFIHLNVNYILFYHTLFWLNSKESDDEKIPFIEQIESTEYEKTFFMAIENYHNEISRPPIETHSINKYIYITLIGINTIELITAFLWTLQKKLTFSVQRNLKWQNRLRLFFIGMILMVYVIFISWLYFHTFVKHYLTTNIFAIVIVHLIIVILLDKSNLFRSLLNDPLIGIFSTRKLHRYSSSSSSSSLSTSITINSVNRCSYRSTTSIQSRKVNSMLHSLFLSIISISRWSSITEHKLDEHQCTTVYSEIREQADNLWPMIVRRMALNVYRTLASIILFDIIPYITMDTNLSSTDNQRYKILMIIFGLSTFLTHSTFLFPSQFRVHLHYLSNHLGQWRLKLFNRTDSVQQWSSECNMYTSGNIIKLVPNSDKHYIAKQHLSNAAHPQSFSHSIIYRFFGDIRYFLTIQCFVCLILIIFQFYWIIGGQFNYEILISILIILNSSYTIFKIIRDRLLFELMNIHQSDQYLLRTKEKKSN